ncbi:MAG: FtsK/SpoIIIE domain-containing protein [Anaerolineales bacterium]
MERAFYPETMLDQQADEIESALTRLALPARVDGGVIRERHVRYHLTPAIGTQPLELAELADDVAREIGVNDLRVLREAGELAIEVPLEHAAGLRLLPLIQTLPRLRPLSALVGMSTRGSPLVLELDRAASWHVLIQAPAGAGKSELLRTLAMSLALSSRPARVGFLALDLSGRELSCLASLPHLLADVASDGAYAVELLSGVVDEMDRRAQTGIAQPHLVLFVDDLDGLRDRLGAALERLLASIFDEGPHSGVHLITAARRGVDGAGWASAAFRAAARIEGFAHEPRGHFHLQCGSESVQAEAAWMSAYDLDLAVRFARDGMR